MTFTDFHLIFILPLLLITMALNFKNPIVFSLRPWLATLTLMGLAVALTVPWESYLIGQGMWQYTAGSDLTTYFSVPLEEYFLLASQAFIASLLAMWILKIPNSNPTPYRPRLRDKTFVVVFTSGIILASLYSPYFAFQNSPYKYLFLIVGWAGPIVLLQWAIGYRTLLRFRKHLFFIISPLTVYFCLAEAIATQKGLVIFSSGNSTGFNLFLELPLEKGVFLLMTNMMIAQGFILFTQFKSAELPVKFGGQPL